MAKRKSNRAKGKLGRGRALEMEFVRLLESKGLEVWRPPGTRSRGSKDVFGLFDLVAVVKRGFSSLYGSRMWFVQVKKNRNDFYTARKRILDWLDTIEPVWRDVAFCVATVVSDKEGKKYWRVWWCWFDIDTIVCDEEYIEMGEIEEHYPVGV